MKLRDQFHQNHPGVFFLDADDLTGINHFLGLKGWLNTDERVISAGKAGEGNMNYTLRVTTSERSFILKQARPWVEKYPQVSAPWDRAIVEGSFYRAISGNSFISSRMPVLLGLDEVSRILMLEDLGEAQDRTSLYRGERLTRDDIEELAAYLSHLHGAFINFADKSDFSNREMRALNHQHIFSIPLMQSNGLNLDAITPGLEKAAEDLKNNVAYVEKVTSLGETYLADGMALLHGDFFPGSWLRTGKGLQVIDPEFCFFGPPEFDLGFFIAHLYLAEQPDGFADLLLESYKTDRSPDRQLINQFAGTEIMRRLTGVAQLPLNYGIEKKRQLLDLSVRLVLVGQT
ncbi:MAG: phosphotransferase [Acidobacteria bacterium]|nr:phosphotransferase [Acidobacteriota bacterium]